MVGIEYPTITLGDHQNLVVRFSLAAQVLMQRRGIHPWKVNEHISKGNENGVQNLFTIFACMVAENFPAAGGDVKDYVLPQGPSVDYWLSVVPIGQFHELNAVVLDSMGKVSGVLAKTRPALPENQKS